jgi:membrane-associated phospholipid phosphatase
MTRHRIVDRVASPKGALAAAYVTSLLLGPSRPSIRIAVGTTLAVAIEAMLKKVVSRRRPLRHFDWHRRSFPSGHSAGTSAYLTALALTAPRRYRVLSLVGAVLGDVGINIIRVSEHEHWPTDVLAGDAIGVISVLGAHWFVEQATSKIAPRPLENVLTPGSAVAPSVGELVE